MISSFSGKTWFHRVAAATLAFAVSFSSSGIAFAVEDAPTIANAGLFTSRSALPQVENSTGAFTYRVPLDIPPGRNGLTPDVALEYNSQNLTDGIVSYGWSLSVPFIERTNKTGTEDLYGDEASFRSSIDGELQDSTSTTTETAIATTTPSLLDSLPLSLVQIVNNTSLPSTTYTVPSGGENKLFVLVFGNNNDNTPTVSLNNVSATCTRLTGTLNRAYPYVCTVPNPSTGTLSVSFGSATYMDGVAFTLQDALQTNPIDVGDIVWSGGNVTTLANSVTTTVGKDFLYSQVFGSGTNTDFTWGTNENETIDYDDAANLGQYAGAWKTAASSAATETITASWTTARDADNTLFSIKGATTSTFATHTVYRPRIDSGGFNSYDFTNDAWVMYDKNGTRYLFGTTTQARQYATTSPDNVYKWMLEEVRDTNGNYIKYEYTSDENQIYPLKITYTGNGSADGPFEIDFTYETRPDPITSYATAFKVQTKKRLTQAQASIDDSWVRKYTLGYSSGVNGARSLLASVTETGRDESGTEVSLPPYSFNYSSSTPTYTTASAPRIWNVSRVVGDVDGNALPDHSIFRNNDGPGYTTWEIKENTYPSFTTRSANNTSYEYWTFSNPDQGANEYPPLERGVRFFDANGDGKADIVKSVKTGSSSYDRVYYQNTYNGSYSWASTSLAQGTIPAFSLNLGTNQYSTGFFGNVNGDGLVDYVLSMESLGYSIQDDNGTYLHVASTTGWTVDSSTFMPLSTMPTSATNIPQHYLVDINGDGLDDWMSSGTSNIEFCLNTGTQWTNCQGSPWNLATTTRGLNGYDKGIRFIDVNGDELPDYMRSYDIAPYGNKYTGVSDIEVGVFNYVYLNTGSGWATSSLQAPASNLVSGVQSPAGWWTGKIDYNEFVDWNGDGTPDHEGAVSTNKKPDVLVQITNPTGGKTNATHKYTSQLAGDNAEFAFPVLVVTELIDRDGRGNEETTTYSYEGGKMFLTGHITDRRFGGFKTITKTDPFATLKTYFNQGDSVDTSTGEQTDTFALIGRPYREDVLSTTSAAVRKTFKRWNAREYLGGYLVGLASEMIQDFATDGSHKDKATDYLYASTTNDLIQVTEFGEVNGNADGTFSDTGTDKRTTNITYAASTSVNMSVPTRKTLLDSNSATTSDEKIFYDSLSFGSVSVGNPTREEQWVSGSTYASSTKTYNSFGLVATSTDTRGNAIGYRYDARNLYVATSTNPLSQQTQYLYDYASGKTKLTIDPNSRRISNTYNGVGRLTEIKQSDLTTPTTLVTAATLAYTDSTTTPSLVRRTDYMGSTTTVDTYQYFDGFKRLIQERKSSETLGTFSVADRKYRDDLVASTSVPYFSSGSSFTTPSTVSALYTSYLYDPLKRVRSVGNIVGTTTNAYAKWTTTATDARGNLKDYLRDAFGNLTTVVEQGSSPATTTYAYDSRNNLATTTDALSNVRAFSYDGLGRRLSAQDLHASGDTTFGSWSYTYDDAGNLTSQTDPRSQVVTRTYDALNRMLTEDYTGAAGTEVTNTYDSCGNGIGSLCTASSTSALIANAYDILGRLSVSTTTISGTAYPTSYTYNRKGDVTNMTYPDLSQVANGYNLAGLLDRVEHKPAGGSFSDIANFNYASHGLPTFTLFGNGASTTRTYNANALYRLSRLLTGTSTPLQDASYTYDANGNIVEITHASNTAFATVRYTYDALNRLLEASAVVSSSTPQQDFTYDNLGSITSIANETITGTSTPSGAPSILDSLDLTKHTINNGTSDSFSYTPPAGGTNKLLVVLIGQNENSDWPSATQNGTALTCAQISGTIDRAYYSYCYLASPPSGTFSISWPSLKYARFIVMTLKDAAQSSPIDASNVTNAITSSKSTSVTTSVGNDLLLSIAFKETAGGAFSSFGTGETQTFNDSASNDMGYQGGAYKAASSTAGTETMTVNLGSSRDTDLAVIAVKSAGSGGASSVLTDSYTYAGTGYTNPHAPTQIANGISTTTFAYDNNGNLIQKIVSSGGNSTTTLHVWDYNNRLIQTAIGNTSTTTTTYGYDAFGMRVLMGVNGATTMYPSRFFSRIFSTSGATTTATTTSYIFSSDTLLATFEGGPSASTTRYSHPDHLGSTNVVTNASGTVVQVLDYYPYGSERINSGSNKSQKTYIGLYSDDSTDLLYANARYLEPSRGQFLSQDPVFWHTGTTLQNRGASNSTSGSNWSQNTPSSYRSMYGMGRNGGISQEQLAWLSDPQAQNSYGYARNNPIRFKDPEGLWYKEFMTGQQSWSSFQGEVGEAAYTLGQSSSGWNFAMNHPYATGALTGLLAAPAAQAGVAGVAAFGAATYPGVGAAYAAKQAFAGVVYSTVAGSSLAQIPKTINSLSQSNLRSPSTYASTAFSVGIQVGPTFVGGHIGTLADIHQFVSALGDALGKLQSSNSSNKKK